MNSKSTKTQTLEIYNLEFPEGVVELNIFNYKFTQVENYSEVFALMPNYGLSNITGSHQITATVDATNTQDISVLPFDGKRTCLDDILLFLSIFSGRNVFFKDWEGEKPILQDFRMHIDSGGDMRLAIAKELNYKVRNRSTGEISNPENAHGMPLGYIEYVSLGLDKAVEKVISHISEREWSDRYDDGYFLFLYRVMLKEKNVEGKYLTAWTMWEHIFSVENRKWMTEEGIYKSSSEMRISFVLDKYFEITLSDLGRKNLKLLVKARNRITHFGKRHAGLSAENMAVFYKATDVMMVEILGLTYTGQLGTKENLKKFFVTKI